VTTYQKTFSLFEPEAENRIPPSTLAYFQARNKHRAYDFVIGQFVKSRLSKASLSRRLGKGNDSVSRWLGAPGNWTLDTLSDLLFAINGGEPEYSVSFPLNKPQRNISQPDWSLEALPPIVVSEGSINRDAENGPNFVKLTPVFN
jgi:hypothetical protein